MVVPSSVLDVGVEAQQRGHKDGGEVGVNHEGVVVLHAKVRPVARRQEEAQHIYQLRAQVRVLHQRSRAAGAQQQQLADGGARHGRLALSLHGLADEGEQIRPLTALHRLLAEPACPWT